MSASSVLSARPSRLISGALALALQLGLALVVWFGFSPQIVHTGLQSALTALNLSPPTPPKPPPPPARHHAKAASGRAAPPHLRAHAAAIVAPPVPPLKPVPIPVATSPGVGTQAASGASLTPGPGSGAGGQGNGTGSGGEGNGEGDGGRDAELIHGRIKDSDIPVEMRRAPFSGTTRSEVGIGTKGEITSCRILRSSGSRLLDDVTCRLIFQRFRFRPALDAQGRAESDTITYEQEWTISGQFGDVGEGR